MNLQRDIKNFILQNFLFSSDEAAFGNSDSLMQRGIVDSTGILELIMYLEETYQLKVRDEEMVSSNFDSVDSIAAFVRRRAGS